jgi:hypothetical protein
LSTVPSRHRLQLPGNLTPQFLDLVVYY